MDAADATCYLVVVTLRHILLAAGGLAVIVAAIYLAIEVRAAASSAPTRTVAVEERSEASESEPASDKSSTPNARTVDGKPTRSGIVPTQQIAKVAGAVSSPAPTLEAGSGSAEVLKPEQIQQIVSEAYKAYDRQEFEEAKQIAARVLASDPKNTRALRIMVSTSCIEANAADAQKYFDLLPEGQDRNDMRKRCGRDYNITFK